MWPMSRKNRPKQFQPLIGEKSIFRQTIDRMLRCFSIQDIYISTGEQHKSTILSEIPELPPENLILEPEMRDTLGAVGYAVMTVHKKFGNTVVATIWGADHYIRNDEEFIKSLQVAEKIASQENLIVNVDAKPTSPNINLGYMEMGRQIKEVEGFPIYEFIRQVEKPDLEKARQFVRSVKYLWHTGYTVFKAELMIDLYKKHAPEVYEILENVTAASDTKVTREEFVKIPKISVDFAIYEKLEKGKIVEMPADLGWSDVGAWNILKDELAENGKALVVKGENYDLGSIDCLFYELNSGKIIATIGCENLVVVDTADALLVASKFKAQEVRKIVEKLKSEGKDRYL